MVVKLYGYQHSVYSWIAKLVLREKDVAFNWIEIDPFDTQQSQTYLQINPFYRVPTLVQGDVILYETQAITRFIDESFVGNNIQPSQPRLRAIQNQLISIVDNYAYWPMVRQVFSHGYFRPKTGMSSDIAQIAVGLEASAKVLAVINDFAGESRYLVHDELSLADLYLYPMIAYLVATPKGAAILQQFATVKVWFDHMDKRPNSLETIPKILKG